MTDPDKLIELRCKLHEQSQKPLPKKDTATEAFCKACKKGVQLPHKCPVDGVEITKVKRQYRGM
jgi:hypothetical protein